MKETETLFFFKDNWFNDNRLLYFNSCQGLKMWFLDPAVLHLRLLHSVISCYSICRAKMEELSSELLSRFRVTLQDALQGSGM